MNSELTTDFLEVLAGEDPMLRNFPMPADTIADNYVSAGWILSQMDLAGGKFAYTFIGGRAVTVSVDTMSFHEPVYVGDEVSCYVYPCEIGTTSLTIKIITYASRRSLKSKLVKVTEGFFKFVHTDDNRKPAPIPDRDAKAAQIAAHKYEGQLHKAKHANYDMDDGFDEKELNALMQERGFKLSLRACPMPRDTNYMGDIFGGWILAQMDLSCLKEAERYVGDKVVTVGVRAMSFHLPLYIRDEVSFYTKVHKIGKTSITLKVESRILRPHEEKYYKLTEGYFSYVAINDERQPIQINSDQINNDQINNDKDKK